MKEEQMTTIIFHNSQSCLFYHYTNMVKTRGYCRENRSVLPLGLLHYHHGAVCMMSTVITHTPQNSPAQKQGYLIQLY